MKIGELARAAGLTVRTIRYYEELGLLEPLERSEGGFRLFSEDDIARIQLIHYLKCLNLPLNKIKDLLSAKEAVSTKGHLVKTIIPELSGFAEETQRKIEKYQKIKNDIEKSIAILKECENCDRNSSDNSCFSCHVIESKGECPLLVRLVF